MIHIVCDRCRKPIGLEVAEGVSLATLRGFEIGHDVTCNERGWRFAAMRDALSYLPSKVKAVA